MRRTGALAATAAFMCLSSGCGVPPSGVVEVGEPATGMRLSKAVFFLDRADSAQPRDETPLHAVPRPQIPDSNPLPTALRQLLAGPTPTESTTLTTALPANLPFPKITITPTTITLHFPPPTPRLPPEALRQLTCTTTLTTQSPRPSPPEPAPTDATLGGISGATPQRTPRTILITTDTTPTPPLPPPGECP